MSKVAISLSEELYLHSHSTPESIQKSVIYKIEKGMKDAQVKASYPDVDGVLDIQIVIPYADNIEIIASGKADRRQIRLSFIMIETSDNAIKVDSDRIGIPSEIYDFLMKTCANCINNGLV